MLILMFIRREKESELTILLYHGTIDKHAADIIVNGINLHKSKPHLDFGPGFYTTPKLEFAIETARFRAKFHNTFGAEKPGFTEVRPVVLELEYTEVIGTILNIKEFKTISREWGNFILSNRCTNLKISNQYDNNLMRKYDIVKGPTADGKMKITPIVENVEAGNIAIEDVNYADFSPSKSQKWGPQISFHTMKALSCIKVKTVLYY